ncbi:TldD/PmbA family protein [Microlunatus antarcticus]|uniref:Putative Zn-dependent protease n=1 Tax=Microlunatus antarcticus TaxID=53388 RepID=A0A7W5JXP5_9ACTN|nr:metallopeptidase TldD-related protein [Microlunatus antarcticus]MBB3328120.1 putative Zn-dependent protease [Microlunatus antarcticus]
MTTTMIISTDQAEPAVGADRAVQACAEAVRAAKAAGADEAEAFLSGRAGGYTRFAVDRVHQPQDVHERQLMVRAVVEGRSARVATTDLAGAADAGRRATGRAAALARAAGPLAALPAPAPARSVPSLAPEVLWDPRTAAWGTPERVGAVRSLMAASRAAGGEAFGMLGRAVTELAVVDADGVERYAAATEAYGSFTVRIDDGTSHWVDLDRRLDVLDLDAVVARTVQEAGRARGRTDLADGTYDVVLSPLATGELLEGFHAYGFTGDAVADGVGAVARRRGERVAPETVDVADDPRAVRGLPFPFDPEGTDASRVPLLDHGVVADAVTDRASASRAGLPLTGHAHIAREETPHPAPASLTMAPGTASVDELVAGVERGVYVQRLWYLRVVDPAATTLTGGSRDACFLIEDGRLTTPVRPARFTESVFGVLSRVDAIGADVLAQPLANVWNGAVSAPAVRVRGFRFGSAASPTSPTTPEEETA